MKYTDVYKIMYKMARRIPGSKRDILLEPDLPRFGVHNPELDKHYGMHPGEQWLRTLAPTSADTSKMLKERVERKLKEAEQAEKERKASIAEAIAQKQSPRLF